jgi:hypothetical protein
MADQLGKLSESNHVMTSARQECSGETENTVAWSKAMKMKLHTLIEEGNREGLIDALNSSCNLLDFQA